MANASEVIVYIGETGSTWLQKQVENGIRITLVSRIPTDFRRRDQDDREPFEAKGLVCARTADAVGMIGDMPTISRFFGIAIVMFFDDHGFPHFHARHAEGEAKVRIDNLEVMDSSLGRRQLRFVLAWAELHQEELEENWRRARAGETLLDIEPLR